MENIQTSTKISAQNIAELDNDAPFSLKFSGRMTYELYEEMEDKVIEATRLNRKLEIDLSEVTALDLCGLHFIGVLQSIGVIVAASPIVTEKSKQLLRTLHSAALRLGRHKERAANTMSH